MMISFRRITFLLLLAPLGVFQSFKCNAQNVFLIQAYKDSLKTASHPIDQVYLLNRIGFEYRYAFPDSTLYYCSNAEVRAKISDYKIGRIEALNYQAIANAYLGNIDSAISQHKEAIQLCTLKGDSLLLAHSRNYLGRLHLKTGDLAEAFDNFANARVIFERRNDKLGISEIYLSLSDLFKSQHDYGNGLELASKALALKKEVDDRNGIIAAHNVLAEIYRLTGDLSNAENNYREAESLASDVEDEADLALIKLGLGELYLESGSLAKAESEAFRADNIITRLSNPSWLSRSTLLLGEIFLKKKNYPQAEAYLLKTLEVSSRLKQLTINMRGNFYLARLYEFKGNDVMASTYEAKYRQLNDSIRNNELALQAEKFNFQLDIERRDRENELLKATEQKNEATIKFQRAVNFGALLVISLVIFFSYFLWQSTRARKRVNQKLSEQNQQLINLNEEKDALMGIVAHDLKTPLSNIKSILGMLPGLGSLTPRQIEFTNLIDTSTKEGLSLIDELLDAHEVESQRKANWNEVSIKEMIEDRVNHFHSIAAGKSISIKWDVKENVNFRTDSDWLTRILDNLISNAIKFSPHQKEINIAAGKNEEELWITIKDQGPGFSETDKAKVFQKFKKLSARPTGGESSNGLGLSIVKTLVERLNGTIALLSEKGEGSEFIIRLPLVQGS